MTTSVVRKLIFAMFAYLVTVAAASSQTAPPSIFFTDLDSGPNSGGESVSGYAGAYVNIYGNNFGTTQGTSTVSWNGLNCLRVVSWGQAWLWYQKITVQLGSSCTAGTGNFQVTVAGQASTAATVNFNGGKLTPSAFTVRGTGHIYCVSTAGSDSSSGTFSGGCWASPYHAAHTMAAGDITYMENGVSDSSQDPVATYNAVISITSGGSAGNPIALVAYPNATVTMNTSEQYCIRQPAVSGPGPYWTVAGINCTITSNGEGFSFNTGATRLVANSISCPNSYGTAACVDIESNGTLPDYIYGNTWNNVGTQVNGQKTYHAMYFSASDDHTDIAWNLLENVHGCRAIQFYDASGRDMGDDHVHDNVINNVVCDAVNFSTMNSDETGGVEAYNNVMYNVGSGPNPPDGQSNYSCFNISAYNNHTTPVKIYNNTCYNAGFSGGGSGSGSLAVNLVTQVTNNIFYQANGQPYLATGATGCSDISTGATNNWYGAGSAPSCSGLSGSLSVNPQVVSTSAPNFQLTSASPMIGAGSTTLYAVFDNDGLIRGTPPAIGAYEYLSGTSVALPAPPTNVTVVVN